MFDFERARQEHERAAKVCSGCPIWAECRIEASAGKASGVYGGALYLDGKRIRNLRTPGQALAHAHRDVVRAAVARSAQLSGADTPQRQKARRDTLGAA